MSPFLFIFSAIAHHFPTLSYFLCTSLPHSSFFPFTFTVSIFPLYLSSSHSLFSSSFLSSIFPFHSTFLLRSLTFPLYLSISPIQCLICYFLPFFSFLSPFSVSPLLIPFYRLLFFSPFLAFTLPLSLSLSTTPSHYPLSLSLFISLSIFLSLRLNVIECLLMTSRHDTENSVTMTMPAGTNFFFFIILNTELHPNSLHPVI